MNLQCLGKLYSGTVYSRKQRNIYEHIYRLYSLHSLQTPLVQKHSGPEKISRKHIYTEDKIFWSHWYPSSGKHIYKLQIKSTKQAVEQPQTLTV